MDSTPLRYNIPISPDLSVTTWLSPVQRQAYCVPKHFPSREINNHTGCKIGCYAMHRRVQACLGQAVKTCNLLWESKKFDRGVLSESQNTGQNILAFQKAKATVGSLTLYKKGFFQNFWLSL